jgi:16S rRNA processing protein RimM
MTSDAKTRRIVLGKIRTAVGLTGWVKVESYTDPDDNILKFQTWQARSSQGWCELRPQNSRWSGHELQVQFEGIADRNAAELLRNTEVAVFRHELPDPAPGEYYWDDLLGLNAITKDGKSLGKLDHFLDSPAHPFMVLKGKDERDKPVDYLVPVIKGRVLSADFDKGEMVLDWTLDWVE